MSVREEIEAFCRVRQLKHETDKQYLLRACRATHKFMGSASERLSSAAYAWVKDAQRRMRGGEYPLDFDDQSIEQSLQEQLFDYLQAENAVYQGRKLSRRNLTRLGKEGRKPGFSRMAKAILCSPGADDVAIATELSKNGWRATSVAVNHARAKLRASLLALKDSGFQVLRADGSRLVV